MKNCTQLFCEAHFVKNTSCPDYFWKLRCGKVHAAAFKVKICKTHHVWLTFGELLEVELLKNCTPLWREAHFELKSQNVKKNKKTHCRTAFGS